MNTHGLAAGSHMGKSNFKGVSTFSPSMETLKFNQFGHKQNVPEFYEGRNALTATEMHCVAFPKRAAENIAKFMEGVPALLSEYLNTNLNQRNGPWYDAQRSLTREAFFGGLETLKKRHPGYLKRVSGQARQKNKTFNEGEFYNTYDYVRTFLLNRTEVCLFKTLLMLQPKHTTRECKRALERDFNLTFTIPHCSMTIMTLVTLTVHICPYLGQLLTSTHSRCLPTVLATEPLLLGQSPSLEK